MYHNKHNVQLLIYNDLSITLFSQDQSIIFQFIRFAETFMMFRDNEINLLSRLPRNSCTSDYSIYENSDSCQ